MIRTLEFRGLTSLHTDAVDSTQSMGGKETVKRIKLPDGRVTRMSQTQIDAYRKIYKSENRTFYSYNGISRATISVLERLGLVDVKWRVYVWTNYRSKRSHSQCDWIAIAKEW